MRFMTGLLIVSALVFYGCDRRMQEGAGGGAKQQDSAPAIQAQSNARAERPAAYQSQNAEPLQVSLSQVDAVQASTVAADHKIIRNATLLIEIDAPSNTLGGITEAAESQGGFLVTSESKQNDGRAQSNSAAVLKAVIRVPSARFFAAIERIKGIGGRVLKEDVTGQDVTEEFLDIEARIRTKKALESQFLEIMKQARTVSEALEVQSQLANVRTEIERLEGRRRFLENQSSMSTITITLQEPPPLVAADTSSFAGNVKEAIGQGIDLTASILLGFIHLVIMLLPIALLILLPLGLILRFLIKRNVSPKKREPVPVVAASE